MGSKYLCRDLSCILGNHILRSVNLSLFDNKADFNLLLLGTWFATEASTTYVQGRYLTAPWGLVTTSTSYALSMAVNTLVTSLIVFKILKVFLNVKPTSVEQRLGSTGDSTKLQNVIFIIIESGMALFVIQLVRIVAPYVSLPSKTINFVTVFNQMFNVSYYKICLLFFVYLQLLLG
jgi:hypothetical protein